MTKDGILLLRQVLDKKSEQIKHWNVWWEKLETDSMYFCSNEFVDLYLETN